MRKFLIGLGLLFLLLCGLAALGIMLLPWKVWLEGQIRSGMQAQGFSVVGLKIADISLDKITLADVQIGQDNPITLKSLAVGYKPLDLLEGRIEDIAVTDLMVDVRQENGSWVLSGVKPSGGAAFEIPDTEQKIDLIPINHLKIEKSVLSVRAAFGNLSLPMDVFWDKREREVLLSSKEVSFASDDMKIDAGNLRAMMHFKDKVWSGTWSLDGLAVRDVATIQAKGTIKVQDQVIVIEGKIESPDMKADLSFNMRFAVDGKTSPKIMISKGNVPWSDGVVHLEKAEFLLDGKAPIRLPLDMQKISLAAIMKLVTGKDIIASGTISGTVPVLIMPDGQIRLEKSHLGANGNGVVSVPPDVIPGSGAQIDLTREVLSNFEYDGLSINVVDEGKGAVAFVLNVSGNNPKVYDGRAVKLNVRLGGDVLEFLQSNIMMLMKPESILDQEKK